MIRIEATKTARSTREVLACLGIVARTAAGLVRVAVRHPFCAAVIDPGSGRVMRR